MYMQIQMMSEPVHALLVCNESSVCAYVSRFYCLNVAPFKQQEDYCATDFRPGLCWSVAHALLHDNNAATMCLATPHFKTNTPMGALMGTSEFATNSAWMLGMKTTTAPDMRQSPKRNGSIRDLMFLCSTGVQSVYLQQLCTTRAL